MGIDPVSLMIVSTLVSAGGAVLEGIQANKMAKYQAKVAQMNRDIANENARRSIERSQVEQQEQDMVSLAFLGAQEAMQGASGLSMSGGSQQLARKSAKELGRLDSLRVRQAGELEAHAFRTEAVNFDTQSRMARAEGKNALVSSFFNAGSSLLTGATRVSKAQRFSNPKFASLVT